MDAVTRCHPHDLVRIGPVTVGADTPRWAAPVLRDGGWVVVRRVGAGPDEIPVGVRGIARAQRHAVTVGTTDVHERRTPAELARGAAAGIHRAVPALHALARLRDRLDDTGLEWGPTGSVGYELCTGVAAVTDSSDLDLLVRVPDVPAAGPRLRLLQAMLGGSPVRVDCHLELPIGAVALAEFCGDAAEVMVRTATGPRLRCRSELVA